MYTVKKVKKSVEKDLKQIDDEIDELYNELMDEYEAHKDALTKRLIEINANLNVAVKTAEIERYITALESSFNTSNQKVKHAFLKQIVNAIVLSPGKAEVYVNLSTPPIRGNFNLFRVSILSIGTPILTIDTLSIYANNGAPLLLFDYMQ